MSELFLILGMKENIWTVQMLRAATYFYLSKRWITSLFARHISFKEKSVIYWYNVFLNYSKLFLQDRCQFPQLRPRTQQIKPLNGQMIWEKQTIRPPICHNNR